MVYRRGRSRSVTIAVRVDEFAHRVVLEWDWDSRTVEHDDLVTSVAANLPPANILRDFWTNLGVAVLFTAIVALEGSPATRERRVREPAPHVRRSLASRLSGGCGHRPSERLCN